MPRRRLSTTEFLAWAGLGTAAGLALGLVLTEWVGDIDRHRVKRALARVTAPPPALLAVEEAAAAAAEALGEMPGLSADGVRRGVVALHGWVGSRAERVRAVLTVRKIPGIDHVLDRILVRGEDDGELLAAEAS